MTDPPAACHARHKSLFSIFGSHSCCKYLHSLKRRVSYTTIWQTLPNYDGNLPKIVSVSENIVDNFLWRFRFFVL